MLFIVGTFLILEYSDDNQFSHFDTNNFPKAFAIFNITQEQFALRLVFTYFCPVIPDHIGTFDIDQRETYKSSLIEQHVRDDKSQTRFKLLNSYFDC